jgi:peptidoglycan/LPS O-acetylase OafA/YrhL
MRLADVAHGKDNNFKLLRLIAAFAVLITHSFAIATGERQSEPLRTWLGMTIGDFAVDAFFVTSGFLVTASLARRQSAAEFLAARVLRVYPALLVMLALTVFVVGPMVTRVPVSEYLSSRHTFAYFLINATMIFDVRYVLPGVFEDNVYRSAVNGSLWSMPWELRMYVLLLSVWLLAKRARSLGAKVWAQLTVAIWVAAAVAHAAIYFTTGAVSDPVRLLFMFFTGASYYVARRFIALSGPLAAAAMAALALSLMDRNAFFVTYNVTLGYLLLWLAYVPGGAIRTFNLVGDYSYGTYIYAFPVQQIVSLLLPGISATGMIAASGTFTLLLAVISWHLIEDRALSLKNKLTERSQQLRHLRAWLPQRHASTSSKRKRTRID